jgi:peptide/nickel transport system substrate-binding protein
VNTRFKRGRTLATASLVGAALVLSGCAQSERSGGSEGGSSGGGGTFVFAGSAEPVTLDPFFASDGESFRVSRQIFEGLVGTKPGTADPAPLLAKSWDTSQDGLSYDFTLQSGVKFQDGSDFNADAVCYNFDRWYNAPKSAQNPDLTYYYGALFGGFKGDKNAIYDSCTADGEDKVTIKLTAPFAGFVSAMSLPAFSMQSPTALKKYQDDAAQNPTTTEYSTKHPVGTGPFEFGSWERGKQVTLKANPDYWGEKSKLDKLVFVAIDDPKARATALQNGEIDGFDLVGPADIEPLKNAGFQIVNREPFNILYLGMNQKVKPLNDIRVRQAIAYAINKDQVVSASMPEGTKTAVEFMPDIVNGWTEDVPKYDYNPDKAKQLLKQAGAEGATIEFNYPTDVSRPYMPAPEDTFNVIRSQLQAVGLKIKPTADKWSPDYLNKIQGTSKHGIHLLGWTGDYNDSDNFLGVFFGKESPEWGFKNDKIFADLKKARGLPTPEEQKPLYEQANKEIMEFVPGVPIAHPVPSLAFAPGVKGFQASPVQDEVYNTVTIEK